MNRFTKKSGKRALLIAAALLTLLASVPGLQNHRAQAQWALMTAEADSLVLSGIDHIYNLQFDSAETHFARVKQLYPSHPVGYFMDAMVDWWRISTNKRSFALDERFLAKVDTVIDLCDDLLDENSGDIVGLFFKGGILGYRGRYFVERKQWVRAASDGNEALGIVQEAWKLAPGNSDVMLGIGVYHYFAAAIPERYPAVKPLMWFLPPGDKRGGMMELELAADRARYAKIEAKVTLMHIFYRFERDYNKSLASARELYERYPRNSLFHKYVARSNQRLGRQDEAEEQWREILRRCIAKELGYDAILARESMYYIGNSLFIRGDNEMALKYLSKSQYFSERIDEEKDEDSGFQVLAVLKVGQIYDRLGRRDEARKQYERVLDLEEYQNSHELAERYLERAFR